MRVNPSLLAAAIALFSTQGLGASKHVPSSYYPTDPSSSASQDKLDYSTTDASNDVYQDDGKNEDVIASNKEVLNKALGSAANGDDYTKYQALNNMSEEELEKIMHAMTPLKKGGTQASSRSPAPTSGPTWDSDANSVANAWATKDSASDLVQDDVASASDSQTLGKGAVASGTGLYSGKTTSDTLSLFDTSGSDDSKSGADEPLASKKYLYSEDWDLDGSSDDDVLHGHSGSTFGYAPFHGVRDDTLVPQKSDSAFSVSKSAPSKDDFFFTSDDGSFDDVSLTAKHSSSYANDLFTDSSDDDDWYAGLNTKDSSLLAPTPSPTDKLDTTNPFNDKEWFTAKHSSSYAKDSFTDSSDEDDWYTGLKTKDTSLLAPSPSPTDKLDTTSSFDDKEWDALFKELSSDASDSGSSELDDVSTVSGTSLASDPALTAQMKANKEKLTAALGPKVVAGGEYSVLNALTKMDQEQLDDLLESFSTSDSDSGSSHVPAKGQKAIYMTPPTKGGSTSDDTDDLLATADTDLKPPSLADYLKGAGASASSDSDSSDSSSGSGPALATLATTSSSSSTEAKPCHVSWWRKLAFWKSEHKCSEARRLRTDDE